MKAYFFAILLAGLFGYSSPQEDFLSSKVSEEVFTELQNGYGNLFQEMKPENAVKLSSQKELSQFFKLKTFQPLRKKSLPFLKQNAMDVYLVSDIRYGENKSEGSFVLLVGDREKLDKSKVNSLFMSTAFVPFDVIETVSHGQDDDDDDDKGEDVVLKTCSVWICMIRGAESDCERNGHNIPENEDCPETNEGCPNTDCSSNGSDDGPNTGVGSGTMNTQAF